MKQFFVLFIGFGLIVACNGKPKNESFPKGLQLVQTGEYTIPIDLETSNSNLLAYIDTWDSKDYLHFVNPKNNTYYFYDFKAKSIVDKIPIEREGPNGIDEVWSTQAISLDTLISAFYKGLFFLNENSRTQVIKFGCYEKHPSYNG
ncbi:DUF4221 family protein [Belliella marina]|uniref:DUF4221 family protein n=1 Tax=Belliella marina TaxID=1644146 RepID=A0ABW4VPC1_9BACT